ncbi:hypothetical protein DEO72_LG6g1140 [Vigna unguiculata]|uniref:Uncharacterized protein n=1 Tax=Vigna unguiculata TaxID=3917 RepID=A0A4D6M6D8_VIGUN|nr:hypothetical protein DEO72_LG6g1140 [Vigna unguiculata]
MVRPANLAQATQSRLGEMNRDSPRPHYAKDPVLVPGPSFEPSPRRRGFALARTSRLSETLQPERGAERDNALFGCLVVLGCLLGGEQLGGEQRYPPQVQASAESDQAIRIRMSRVES